MPPPDEERGGVWLPLLGGGGGDSDDEDGEEASGKGDGERSLSDSRDGPDAGTALAGALESLVTRAGQRRVADGHLRGGTRGPESSATDIRTVQKRVYKGNPVSLSDSLPLDDAFSRFWLCTLSVRRGSEQGAREGRSMESGRQPSLYSNHSEGHLHRTRTVGGVHALPNREYRGASQATPRVCSSADDTRLSPLSPSLADWVDSRVPNFDSIAEVLPRKAAPAVVPTQARRAVWTHAALHAAVVRWAGAGAGRAWQILLLPATSQDAIQLKRRGFKCGSMLSMTWRAISAGP